MFIIYIEKYISIFVVTNTGRKKNIYHRQNVLGTNIQFIKWNQKPMSLIHIKALM